MLRAIFNDIIGMTHRVYQPYVRAAVPIAQWAATGNQREVLDLASAGGEHITALVSAARRKGVQLPKVIVSDLFPVPEQWRALERDLGSQAVGMIEAPVSALEVPPGSPRYWSIFTALHHFPPEMVQKFLRHMTEQADGLVIGKYFQRNWYSMLMAVLGTPLLVLAPLIARRVTLPKILLGVVIPIAPLCTLVDGIVSVARTYRPEEIIAMLPEGAREQFTIEHRMVWYGFAPMKASLVFITRKQV